MLGLVFLSPGAGSCNNVTESRQNCFASSVSICMENLEALASLAACNNSVCAAFGVLSVRDYVAFRLG